MSKYVNGTNLPRSVSRSDAKLSWPPLKDNIVAIDFGTSSCSVAYFIKGLESGIQLLNLGKKGPQTGSRVPNEIVIDSSTGKVVGFGFEAATSYQSSPADEKRHRHFFRSIKMNLHHKSVHVHLNSTVEDSNKEKFFLVEVIAMTLKYIKDEMFAYEARGEHGQILQSDNFDWIITVPAIWTPRGKQMIREAAYKAGLTTDDPAVVIKNLTPVGMNTLSIIPNPPNPFRLSLALEPEVAAIHCKKSAKQNREFRSAKSKCYMVVDIGGGTVDITAHRVNDNGSVDVILPPTGDDYGGSRVNDEFMKFLFNLVDDPDFTEFIINDSEKASVNRVEINEINKKFEDLKLTFCNGGFEQLTGQQRIRLAFNFAKHYAEKLAVVNSRNPEIDVEYDHILVLPNTTVEKLFTDVIEGIKECFRKCMDKVADQIDTIFLVGGFGGSKYIHSVIEKEVQRFWQARQYNVYRAADHVLAVVLGAIKYRQKQIVVSSRVATATYGTSTNIPFNPEIHSSDYRVQNDEKKDFCQYAFSPFIRKDDYINSGKLLQINFVPFRHNQKQMTIGIFTSQNREFKYALTPDGQPKTGIDKIGEIVVNMPVQRGDKSRIVRLTLDFTQTEIYIEGHDVTSGEKVHTIVDFLSFFSGQAPV